MLLYQIQILDQSKLSSVYIVYIYTGLSNLKIIYPFFSSLYLCKLKAEICFFQMDKCFLYSIQYTCIDAGFLCSIHLFDTGSLYSIHIWIQVPCTLYIYGYWLLVLYTYMDTGSLYSIHIWIQVPCTLYIYGYRFLALYTYMDTGSLYFIDIWIQVPCTLYIYMDTGSESEFT